MALSNWDTLAFDSKGKPCDGTMTAKNGSMVEIYKNYALIGHPEVYKAGKSGFVEPWISQVWHGQQNLLGLEIQAKRCAQYGMFIYCKYTDWSSKTGKYPMDILAGIGCSGFGGNKWIGVSPKLLKQFMAWLTKIDPDYAKLIDPKKALRFNQGDSFINSKFNQKTTGTKPGKAKTPIMVQMLTTK